MSPDKANLLIVTYVICVQSCPSVTFRLLHSLPSLSNSDCPPSFLLQIVSPSIFQFHFRYADLKRCLYTSFDELLQVRILAYIISHLPSLLHRISILDTTCTESFRILSGSHHSGGFSRFIVRRRVPFAVCFTDSWIEHDPGIEQ